MRPFRWITRAAVFPLAFAGIAGLSPTTGAADVVSFRRDVMAVLAKAGCNQGACHGNFNGKGGFRLSLRGQDPAADFLALTRDQRGRRVNPADPDRSLILAKPTLAVAHEGGRRFDRHSPEYEILRQWIAAGMPPPNQDEPALASLEVAPRELVLIEPSDRVPLEVTALFSGGEHRDVRRLAVYEPSDLGVVAVSADGIVSRRRFGDATVNVRYLDRQASVRLSFVPARADFVPRPVRAENEFDVHVFSRLAQLRQTAAPAADDATFVRRAFLDLTGVLPMADEAREFIAGAEPDKRARLVDALLARPEFADHFALKWADLLRSEEKQLDAKGVAVYHAWIRRSIAEGKPLDRFVRELVTAVGSTYESAPANFYRALRDPVQRGEAVAQVFLGTRLQCAKCHNHPFERWTQDDYYRWAALFARIDYKIVKNERRDDLDKHEFNGEQIVLIAEKGEVKYPSGDEAPPKLLGGDELDRAAAGAERLGALAAWLVRPDNDLFVRVQANRIWRQVIGVGIVEPVDDFRVSNPPTNPPLLDAVARDLAQSGFDLRHVVRRIAASHAYQSASVFDPAEHPHVGDAASFARAAVLRLSAEQMLDAIHQTAGVPLDMDRVPPGTRAGQLPGVAAITRRKRREPAADFLRTFGKPARLLVCECERGEETTLAQTFTLVSGEIVQRALAHPGGRLARWAKSDVPIEAMIDELYWTALSRGPTAEERRACQAVFAASPDRLAALQDIAWAVINAKEFVFRH